MTACKQSPHYRVVNQQQVLRPMSLCPRFHFVRLLARGETSPFLCVVREAGRLINNEDDDNEEDEKGNEK